MALEGQQCDSFWQESAARSLIQMIEMYKLCVCVCVCVFTYLILPKLSRLKLHAWIDGYKLPASSSVARERESASL